MEDKNRRFTLESNLDSLFDDIEGNPKLSIDEHAPLIEELKGIRQRYTQKTPLARGGMKTISKVFDQQTGRCVAMAKLHESTLPELYEPFLREARLTALLDHPNIISIYDIGLDSDKAPYFTMELKTGQGLDQLIKNYHKKSTGPTTGELNHLLEIFLKICDGISYAHAQQLLHLDIKPENIQVGLYGEVTICDWGLGKIIGDPNYDGGEFDRMLLNPDLLNHMTVANKFRGTPGFMAPEQLNQSTALTSQTDIYALGALLYTILTGEPPICLDGSLEQIISLTTSGEIIPPDERFPTKHISRSLSAVTMKSLQLNPDLRYPSTQKLRSDIYNFITGYSTIAEKAGFLTELKLLYRRNKITCGVILSAIILLGSITAVFIVGLANSKTNAERSRLKAVKSQRTAILEKERAQRILELYQEEKVRLSTFVEEHYSTLKNEVYSFTDTKTYEDTTLWLKKALSYLNRMVRSKPEKEWPYMQRGYVHFLMQNLQQAKVDFAINDDTARLFHNICKKYSSHAQSGKLLEITTLVNLFEDLKSNNCYPQLMIMLLYDGAKRQSLTDHSRLIKQTLELYNRQWVVQKFNYDEKSATLHLGGKGLSRLCAYTKNFSLKKQPGDIIIPLLKTLRLKKLDLSQSEIFNISELRGLSITKLDLRHTLINSTKDISTILPNLRELTITKGQFPKNDPIWTQKEIKVIVKRE